MKQINLNNVQEAGEYKTLPAGAYICKIISAVDHPDKEYLLITYDIARGEYTGYYSEMRENHPDWASVGTFYRSYKSTALPMFKRFCSAVSKSNMNFVFDGNINADEHTLAGKLIGIVLGEEEYYSNSGDLKTRLVVAKEFPCAELDKQKVPALKKLPADNTGAQNSYATAVADSSMEEVPY